MKSKTIKLPSGEKVTARTKVGQSKNFDWGEATKELTRIPPNLIIEKNIISTALRLEQVRAELRNFPIIISSWYRDYYSNSQVGGSKNSKHLQGIAVDFVCPPYSSLEIYKILDKKFKYCGIGLYSNWIHFDDRGSYSRWEG